MANSMTGYGKGSVALEDTPLHVEVKSVNHRFLDITAHVPRALLFMEEKLKKEVSEQLSRGRLDLFITMEGNGPVDRKVVVDWQILDQYMDRIQEVKDRYMLTGQPSIDMVTRLEDVFVIKEIDGEQDALQDALLKEVRNATASLIRMREMEGERLTGDLTKRLSKVTSLLSLLNDRRPVVIKEHRGKILSRMEDYLSNHFEADNSRMLQEVGLLAEKGDVTEELTRMESHTFQFKNVLLKKGPIGRQLDFIVQEMHREVNTIGSKSNDAKITEWVVELKTEIEKIKEQVQNIE